MPEHHVDVDDTPAEWNAELAAAVGDVVGIDRLDELLPRLAQRARQLTGADYAAVATVATDGRTTWRAISGNVSDAWRETSFPSGRGTVGRVVAANAPIVIANFPNDPAFPPEEFPAHAAERMRTAVGVPLRRGGEPFGAVIVGWRRDVPGVGATAGPVQALADIAAMAMTNAGLLAAAERRATQLEATNAELAAANQELERATAQLEEQATELEMLNTELSERNMELDARAAELSAVLDQMVDGVVISDADGEIVRANPAAERMHGRRLLSARRDAWSSAFHLLCVDGSAYPPDELPLARAVDRGETVEGAEWLVERPDGTRVRLLGSAAPLRDGASRLRGAVLVMRDVTERARLIEQVQQATATKERFFAQMSHELRTPVNAVLGYSALIADGLAGDVPPGVMAMVERIRKSGQHLLELVNDVLDISRLEAGKVQIEPAELDLVQLAHDTLPSVEPQANAKGLTLELRAPDSLRVISDAARIRQILLNLVSNAVKFTSSGGVTIEIAAPDADRVRLAVADTGIGIAPENLERVFAEFVQVGGSTGGTGLGLTISRRLARLLGGDLTAESEVGRGSRFTLTLPMEGRDEGRGTR